MNPHQVPDREELLDQLRRANRYTWLWIATRLVAIAALVYLIRWDNVVLAPIVSVTACMVILGPFLMSVLRVWGQKKKRIEDIKESTRFGDLDKHKLQSLYSETLRRLKLPDERLPVYVTSDKSLNAGALRLGSLFGRLNGIYLNRQVLHKLRGEEVQSIMGHELGHYYRFNLAGDRFRILTLVLGALVGIFAVQATNLNGFLGFVVLSVVSYGFWTISNLPMMRYGRTIEYLCDDLGAQVQGVEAAISGLLKVGLDAETRTLIHLELLAQHSGNALLSPQDVSDAIDRGTPYGHAAEPELYESIGREIEQKRRANQQTSLTGFLKYIWESDDEDEDDLKERLEMQAKAINQIQRLEWESVLDDPDDIRLTERQAENLVQLILSSPGKYLFRVPEMIGQSDGIHPPIEQRILYLWKNRNLDTELVV
ncbi:M48 family metalloprotease [Stieleria sp. TO1_6]|uniref:M48 family metallopeptidase n=1 Tax=Stieleria tagensis TaxID=2956795 RepID=UPI00209ABCCF|nr:M48 family metalloprotease [Stieleria tagensis]MCO8121793.1 M48 family metalloprotease [Stieleria tagensis]